MASLPSLTKKFLGLGLLILMSAAAIAAYFIFYRGLSPQTALLKLPYIGEKTSFISVHNSNPELTVSLNSAEKLQAFKLVLDNYLNTKDISKIQVNLTTTPPTKGTTDAWGYYEGDEPKTLIYGGHSSQLTNNVLTVDIYTNLSAMLAQNWTPQMVSNYVEGSLIREVLVQSNSDTAFVNDNATTLFKELNSQQDLPLFSVTFKP